ncbi:MAG: hypothetical protein H0V44_12405, partial [Planctomycetes bacterium]|nr:hypothetical protein [Planctomycetota bacterium]
MANDDIDDQNDELLDEEQLEGEEEQKKPTGWVGWAISFSFHALLIILMTSIYFLVAPPEVDVPPVRVATIEPPP